MSFPPYDIFKITKTTHNYAKEDSYANRDIFGISTSNLVRKKQKKNFRKKNFFSKTKYNMQYLRKFSIQ